MGFDNDCILNIKSLAGEYFCRLCNLLVYPNEALQAPCTHLYCKPCLTYAVSTTHACFHDEFRVTEADCKPLLESNKALADTIGKILVRCLYYRTGCTWQGPLSDCISHCPTCSFGEHRQVQEHAQICPGVQSQVQQILTGVQALLSAPQAAQAAQAAAPTSEQWYQQQQYQEYPLCDSCQQKTQVSTEAQTEYQVSQPKQFQPHAKLYAHKPSTLSKKIRKKKTVSPSTLTKNFPLRRLLVLNAQKESVKAVSQNISNRINGHYNDMLWEFTLKRIGGMFNYHQHFLSIKYEKLRMVQKRMTVLKIKKKYGKVNGETLEELLKKQYIHDLKLVERVLGLTTSIVAYAFHYISVAAEEWDRNELLELRHLGDYVVGRMLIKGCGWGGRMRLLLAGKAQSVIDDIMEEAMDDGLFSSIVLDYSATETDSESDELDDESSDESKFEFHDSSDEDQDGKH